MKITPFWGSIALTFAPTVLAQGLRQATGGPEPTTTVQWYPTPTPEVSNCTASLITTLSDYKDPGPEFAVASSGKAHCWEYCNAHQPCNFVIFAKGNPYTGTGTCWLYPGENFDESAGTTGSDHLSVYNKPECAEATQTSGACTATASPSAVASVCGYPTPDDDCFYSCAASSGAADCLNQCADADSCSYAVFNPHNPSNSPYASGTCWKYPNGTYDATKASTCSGAPEQFVYDNPCPKASSSSSPPASSSSSGSSPSATGSTSNDAKAEGATQSSATPSADAKGSAHTGHSLSNFLAACVAILMWQGLRR
ncbi:hypothetical protein SLS60_006040 [Paraconiothyrium brasiliense]|uniref:Apple domain-containing protein n=1 Tax=Paraconiothyrium brasiliense TaxID=300254 RepID=A0ABR3REK1_9PLEO